MKPKPSRTAFGWPGIEPRWTHGDKDGVGTAYAASSRIWFTLWNGVITEVYYPTVDHPQIRDLQYLVTDGKTFFHEEKRHLKSKCERLSDHALGYRITNIDPGGRYAIIKEVIKDPHSGCILQHTQLSGDERFISKLRLYTLCAPHLQVGGSSNNGHVIEVAGRKILMAQKKGIVKSTVIVKVNGEQVFKATNSRGKGKKTQVWEKFVTTITATSSKTTISFINGDPPNDNSNGLDAITVVPRNDSETPTRRKNYLTSGLSRSKHYQTPHRKLGLLPERRIGSGGDHTGDIGSDRPVVVREAPPI